MKPHERLKANIDLLKARKNIADYQALAVKAGVAPNTVHNAVKGTFSTSLASLDKIAKALGVALWQLFAPVEMLDDALARECGQLTDAYRQASVDNRRVILSVAKAQASAGATSTTHSVDPSED